MPSQEQDWAHSQWTTAYGQKPTWGPAEWKCLAVAIKRSGDSFNGRWQAFLASKEPFYRGHNPRKFLADLDRWFQPADRSQTHDEYGWVLWCDHAGIDMKPDPDCSRCIAREAELT